ncbi:NAD(P)/FAD-dependent oxidoreductase [Psychrobacter aestuarii]|uniref:NAD(P)/FAD-dependent oxidoreductase n=1 Tax=Psychrobacter aestuarii TaxID=556327 RepID=A0ABN0VJZ3_9GAMM|nr:NAD(P)/FAD-dependent oxidoreductase [Psychrobacter aestuarii]
MTGKYYDAIIIGAGASGLYCALHAGQRGLRVLVLDHANKAGKKILMSGGGRCNFTNYFVAPEHFISANSHFCKSALSRYPSWEFIAMVERHQVAYHEREHGQLFCDDSAQDILTMLLDECQAAGVEIRLNTQVDTVSAQEPDATDGTRFAISTTPKASKKAAVSEPAPTVYHSRTLVVATGGLSIPTMGASGLGYQLAEQFGHSIEPCTASLVPFTFTDQIGELIRSLSGVSIPVVASNARASFRLPLLFTHRGLSGPSMLQLSNYWHTGETIDINLFPNTDISALLIKHKQKHPKQLIRTVLAEHASDKLPKKLLSALQTHLWHEQRDTDLANIKDEQLHQLGEILNGWTLKPSGTEGYRTAEVTRGGVTTEAVSSKTMESKQQQGLYFIGEVLDMTGWLGGYNFQWAWASGYACAQAL